MPGSSIATGRRARSLRSVATTILTGSVFLAGMAVAQINPFGKNPIYLNDEDLQQLGLAARQLTKPTAAVGQTENWANPKTGNSGTIELLGTFEKSGLPCQKRRYVLRSKDYGQNTYLVNMCRLPSGEWKIAS